MLYCFYFVVFLIPYGTVVYFVILFYCISFDHTIIIVLCFTVLTMLYSIILKRYNGEVLKLLRSYEKDDFKLSKSQADLDFLISCQTHNLIPKFLQFKLYAKNICNRNEYKRYQKRLLQGEIDSKKSKIRSLKNEVDTISRLNKICHMWISSMLPW